MRRIGWIISLITRLEPQVWSISEKPVKTITA